MVYCSSEARPRETVCLKRSFVRYLHSGYVLGACGLVFSSVARDRALRACRGELSEQNVHFETHRWTSNSTSRRRNADGDGGQGGQRRASPMRLQCSSEPRSTPIRTTSASPTDTRSATRTREPRATASSRPRRRRDSKKSVGAGSGINSDGFVGGRDDDSRGAGRAPEPAVQIIRVPKLLRAVLHS